jgi:hypothetical protein
MTLTQLTSNLFNIPGWSSSRKIIIFESDDWGSIRMPSLTAYEKLKAAGLDLDGSDARRYNTNDTLESAGDLNALFEVLTKYKGADGNHPKFTLVANVANPDFDAIRASDFESYQWEPSTVTFDRYGRSGVKQCLAEGLRSGIINIQFHGREHLNVQSWMRALLRGDQQARLAFDHGCWGYNNINSSRVMFQAAFDLELASDITAQHIYLKEGLDLFEHIYGYRAKFFVPPNGPYNYALSATASTGGVTYLSLGKKHYEVLGGGKRKLRLNWLGKRNSIDQVILTRNAAFEPGMNEGECVEACLRQIETSFRWCKPAVISTHRVNYVGSLQAENRERGLRKLDTLISGIIRRWPDVHFMDSVELGDLIKRGVS